jgi:hypothetical protein
MQTALLNKNEQVKHESIYTMFAKEWTLNIHPCHHKEITRIIVSCHVKGDIDDWSWNDWSCPKN